MRKAIALATALLILLTACGKDPGGEDPVDKGSEAEEEIFRNLDSDRAFVQSATTACETEDAVYFVAQDKIANGQEWCFMIYYVDKATGISGPLCGKPECGHDTADCNAYIFTMPPEGLGTYNGRLYWIARSSDYKYYIYSAKYDGTDRRTVRELPGEQEEVGFKEPVITTAFHRGYVYVTGNPGEVVDGEQQYRNYICAYSLDSGEDIVILDEVCASSIDTRTQLYGDTMYILTLDHSGEGDELTMLRWDVQTHEPETLFNGKAPFAPGVEFWVTEEGIFLKGTELDGESTDEEGNPVWERYVYFYDFAAGGFAPVFPIDGRGGRYGFADGLFVVKIDKGNAFDLIVYDFEGQTVLETSFKAGDLPDPILMSVRFAGADEDNVYLYSDLNKYLVSVPLNGGEPTVAWSGEQV